ncbi:MAG: hypothetical protein AAFO58_06150, partial [Pseudomonadota bacterium]
MEHDFSSKGVTESHETTQGSDETDAGTDAGIQLSRRRLLQVGAATPLALSATTALAADTDADELDLDFAFDAARKTVTVTALFDRGDGAGLTPTNQPIRWTVDANRFGPDARFFFATKSTTQGAKEYELRIAGGRFGEVENAGLKFTFIQRRDSRNGRLRFGI